MSVSREKISREMRLRRRDFHRYPETGWTEFRTTAIAADILTNLGYSVRFGSEFLRAEDVMGRDIDAEAEKKRALSQGANPGTVAKIGEYTGLCAELDSGKPGPVTALRFDIDCVDTTEASDAGHLPAREGFASLNPGWMHACGHDGHTAVGLALAELLAAAPGPRGKIRLLFQPAEEGVRGGYAMMKAGLVDDASYFIAMHLGLGKPTGEVYGGVNGFLCTAKFDALFRGVGAHAGGEPQKGKNALLAAASAALNLHAIAPHPDGATRINVGVLNAGEGRNVIAPKALMKIETRGGTDELAAYVYERARLILEGAAHMYGAELAITKQGEANSTGSSPELAALISEAAKTIHGVTLAGASRPMAGSDDACWLMKRVQERGGQATYVGIGAETAAGHHNDRFDFDETAMDIALEVLYRAVKKLNA